MKCTTLIVPVMLLAGVFAGPTPKHKRDLEDYEEILDGAIAQIDVAAADLNGYIAGTVPGTTVQASAEALVVILNDAAVAVVGFDPLTVLDTLQLISRITNLVDDVDALADTIIDAEDEFIADGLNDEVLATLYDFRDAGEALRDALTPKVPAGLQGTANDLADQVVADLERVITAYTD
ncbi:hydrophobic surface binding protein A-domain-containing protein [Aspergillus granulosus]|uniref:Hydrophobic surface binding protein A-domain-containing protein n=1 Tax=Aspergillus granulosus TaxID=176169 RepID=A0ABR4HBF0_9EURO